MSMKIKKIVSAIILFSTYSCYADSSCSSSSPESMVPQAETALKINQVKSTERVYFYTQPEEKCKTKTFVINNDRLISFKRYNDFEYVAYINKSGSTVNGWVKGEKIFDVKYPDGFISASDYIVNLDKVNISLGQPVSIVKNEVLAKTGKEVKLNMIGSDDHATVFGIDFPYNRDASAYVSDLNHSVRNNAEESVSQINIYSGKYETSRGIKIGDDLHLVLQKYGNDGITDTQNDGVKTLSFQYIDMALTFSFNATNKVDSIVYVLLPWSSAIKDLQCSNNVSLLYRISSISHCK